MMFLAKVFRFYLQSSMHVALGVVSLAAVTLLQKGLPPGPVLLLFIFFGTVTGYNYVKYAGVANLYHLQIEHLRIIRVFTLVCLILLIYLSFFIRFEVLTAAAIFGALTVLYALPVVKKTNLRGIKGLKVFIIATVWAGMTVVIPLLRAGFSAPDEMALLFVQRFLFVIALMIPFEIRDLKYDELHLATLPQLLGIRNTKLFGVALLILMVVLQSFQTGLSSVTMVSLSIAVMTSFAIMMSKVHQSAYFAAFWVEAIPILWLMLMLYAAGGAH